MKNQTQIFESAEFGLLEILMIDGKPYFPAKECATMLGYSRARNAIDRHCKGALKRGVLTSGGQQEKTYIPEGDLYRLIIRSRLPAAVRFEAFVCDEILPSIRQHGTYLTNALLEELDSQQNCSNDLFRKLLAERRKATELKTLTGKLTQKAVYYDLVLQSQNTIATTVIAKDYGMSVVSFNQLLHDLQIQYKCSGVWLLYQPYAGKGYTKTRTYFISESQSVLHTYWTQAGRCFLYETLKRHGILPMLEFGCQAV
ncbi:MAG: phage antirepressor KilAC domain-containing protein [Oscillospiraceae bacterium]|nr:phage antirepressor KilAC domain-containing protein [Oscillospiraceae bacterium]